jgi:hypothetical protein
MQFLRHTKQCFSIKKSNRSNFHILSEERDDEAWEPSNKIMFVLSPQQGVLLREIIVVYSENHMKPTNTLCGQN